MGIVLDEHVGDPAADLAVEGLVVEARLGSVLLRRRVDEPVHPRPESRGEAHRARLAGGVERAPRQVRRAQGPRRGPERLDLGVRRRVGGGRHAVGPDELLPVGGDEHGTEGSTTGRDVVLGEADRVLQGARCAHPDRLAGCGLDHATLCGCYSGSLTRV